MLSVTEVDRVTVTTVVDNYVDLLRQDEKVASRFSAFAARQMPDLRAEHGLAHHVEVVRGTTTSRIAFDFGSSDTAMAHNFRALGLDPSAIDVLALSHGHWDHWGGLGGFLRSYRRQMKRGLTLYAGEDHFLRRFTQRGADRVSLGRLHREEIERHDIQVESVRAPLMIADGVLLSGEMHEHEAFETIPENLRVERDGQIVPDQFLGEQTLITNVRGRGLVVVTSCSHRGIVGICRHAARITGVPKVHAVIGGFHLSGLREERVTRVVDAFRDLEVDWIVPQHCTGLEAMASMMHRLPHEMVPSSVGSAFTFGR